MAYDILGNFTDEDNSDEAIKAQQQQTADLVSKKAAAAQPAPAPVAPVAPQEPQAAPAQPAPAPVAPKEPQPAPAQAGPVAPQPVKSLTPDYNTYTAKMESGNKPDIGYHSKDGSAYGTYGITSAAYKDIQKANPQFKDRPITSLTPEEQAQANMTYKGVLGQQLQAQGIDPNEANTRLAHFMGAKGASDYLKTGAISPQAAAANGGMEKTKAIAEGRLAGGMAPASGAASQDWARQFVTATQDPSQLSAIRNDPSVPKGFRQAAAEQDYQVLSQEREAQVAQKKLEETAKSGNWLGLAKELKSDSNQGSIFKAMFYKQAGLDELAASESAKLGVGRTWQNIDLADGTQGVVQVGVDGLPIKGYTATGEMDASQLEQAVGMGGLNGKADYVGGSVINDSNGQIGRLVSKNNKTMVESGGRLYPPTAAWRNNTVGTDVNAAYNKSFYSAQGQEQGKGAGEGLTPGATQVAPGAPRGVAGNGPGNMPGPMASQGQPQQMAPQPGGPVAPPQPGMAPAVPGQISPGMAQQPQMQPQMAPQQPAPQAGPYTGAIAGAGPSPSGQPQGGLAQQRQNLEMNTVERTDFVGKVKPDIAEKADTGRKVASIRRQQMDIILKNPELVGMLNGQGGAGGEAANIVRDLVAGNFKDQPDLSNRINALNLSQNQKNALYTLSGLQTEILPATLKSVAGAGTITEAEHKMNREANVDATRVPLYTGLTLMTRNQFQKDLDAYRNDWGDATGQQTRSGESSNWAVEKNKLDTSYNNIYKARADYISKYGSTPAAVVDAFKYYPTPVYDPQTKSFQYSGYSAQAAAGKPPLSSFNR